MVYFQMYFSNSARLIGRCARGSLLACGRSSAHTTYFPFWCLLCTGFISGLLWFQILSNNIGPTLVRQLFKSISMVGPTHTGTQSFHFFPYFSKKWKQIEMLRSNRNAQIASNRNAPFQKMERLKPFRSGLNR